MQRLPILVGRLKKSVAPTKYFFKVTLVGRFMPLVDVISRLVESPLQLHLVNLFFQEKNSCPNCISCNTQYHFHHCNIGSLVLDMFRNKDLKKRKKEEPRHECQSVYKVN